MINFKDKKILITGATGGIGNALVKKFVSLEGNVLATGTKTEKLNALKKQFPKINILILSMHDNSTMAKKVIDAGATGYILKNDIADDLINAIYSVSKSEAVFSESIKKSLASKSKNILSSLNDKELEILKSLAKGNDLKIIATDINISYKTAANYQTSIKHKLELKTSMDLFKIAKDNDLI